jgi:uncharacterized protein with PQ loop repeat
MNVFHHILHEHEDHTSEHYRKIHSKKWIRFVDKYIYVIALMSLSMTLPQIYDIWVTGNVSGISLISWLAYTLSSVVWLAYGLGHKEKVIIYSNICWIVLDLLIVVGIIVFR